MNLTDAQITLINTIGYTCIDSDTLTGDADTAMDGLIAAKLVRLVKSTKRGNIYELGVKGLKVWRELQVINKPYPDEPAIVEADVEAVAEIETPRTCTCGQLLSADETKCATCIYWNAQGLKRPATKLVMGRDGIVLGILQDGEAQALAEQPAPTFKTFLNECIENEGSYFYDGQAKQKVIEYVDNQTREIARLRREISQLMDDKLLLGNALADCGETITALKREIELRDRAQDDSPSVEGIGVAF